MNIQNNNVGSVFTSMLDEIMNTNFGENIKRHTKTSTPKVNVVEHDKNYEVQVAAPGLEKSDFDISVKDSKMSISTEQKTEKTEVAEEDNLITKEFSYSHFTRNFTLSEDADVNKIKAKYDDGILSITIAKKAIAKEKIPHRVEIK